MHADRRLGIKAAQALEVTARTRLEAHDAVLDTVGNRRVVADVEVQMAQLAKTAPIAAVQYTALLDVDCAGDDLALVAGHHEAQILAKPLGQ